MVKLFKCLSLGKKENELEIDCFNYKIFDRAGKSQAVGYKDINHPDNLDDVMLSLTQGIDAFKSQTHVSDVEVEIKLYGKLNGKPIERKFNDVQSYRSFLEDEGLVHKQSHLHNIKR